MEFSEFKDWALLGLLTSGVMILWEMLKSVQALNVKIAVVCEKVDNHDDRIKKIEKGA